MYVNDSSTVNITSSQDYSEYSMLDGDIGMKQMTPWTSIFFFLIINNYL